MEYQKFVQNYKPSGEPSVYRRNVKIHARRVVGPRGDEAQITVEVADQYESGRVVAKLGGIELSPDEARRLALALCPELAQAG